MLVSFQEAFINASDLNECLDPVLMPFGATLEYKTNRCSSFCPLQTRGIGKGPAEPEGTDPLREQDVGEVWR